MGVRGSAKTAADASARGSADAPAPSSDFAETTELAVAQRAAGTVSEVEREAAGSHRGQGAGRRPPSSPPLSAPSLAEATAELRDAQHALDKAISFWWQHSPETGAAIARRWWTAREVFRDAIAGEK